VIHRFQKGARQPLIAVTAEGVAAGDFPSHIDAELHLLGVIFLRTTNTPFLQEHPGKSVNTMLGVTPKSNDGQRPAADVATES